jgi:hypothetical protein
LLLQAALGNGAEHFLAANSERPLWTPILRAVRPGTGNDHFLAMELDAGFWMAIRDVRVRLAVQTSVSNSDEA